MCNRYLWRKQNKPSYSHHDLLCLAVTNTFLPSHFQFKPSINRVSHIELWTWIISMITSMYRILPVSITFYIYIHVHACKKCNSPPTHWILNLLGTSWMHRKQWSKKAVMIKSWQVELLLSNPTFISTLIFISKILSSLLLEKKDKWSLLTDHFLNKASLWLVHAFMMTLVL